MTIKEFEIGPSNLVKYVDRALDIELDFTYHAFIKCSYSEDVSEVELKEELDKILSEYIGSLSKEKTTIEDINRLFSEEYVREELSKTKHKNVSIEGINISIESTSESKENIDKANQVVTRDYETTTNQEIIEVNAKEVRENTIKKPLILGAGIFVVVVTVIVILISINKRK